MSGYRFCRTDDVPLLVEAHNRCYAVHFGERARLTIEDFKRATREIDLWASSCMVAVEGCEPVAVLLSGKREESNAVFRIGVHPEHVRRGHGRHLLDSLSRKLGILGPPRISAEVPADRPDVRAFFERCDYRERERFRDFVREAPPDGGGGNGLVNVSVAELLDSGALAGSFARSWERSPETLLKRAAELEGLAVVTDVRVEAYVVHRACNGEAGTEVVAMGSASPENEPLLEVLVSGAQRLRPGPVFLPRIGESEVASARLESWGFKKIREWVGYETLARSGGT